MCLSETPPAVEKAKTLLEEDMKLVRERQKLIRMANRSELVRVPAPSQRKEGSGTLRIADLFFTPHGYRGTTIECESVIVTYTFVSACVHSIAIPIPII